MKTLLAARLLMFHYLSRSQAQPSISVEGSTQGSEHQEEGFVGGHYVTIFSTCLINHP